MTLVVGVDVTVVDRIAAVLLRHPRFAERIYTPAERRISARKPERWASRWAAKEAVRKVCSSRGEAMPAYRDIEVVRRRGGPPRVHIRGEETNIALSLTHDGGLAIAVAASMTLDVPAGLPPSPEGVVLAARPNDGHKGT
ncbi:MAG: holo-[acyl-carrier protein] synthase, partial [Chloroflexota bacterium]|nr:holo-[acyl-carrier protein] synthase [Chloroflexota bacterium]